jgi:hypothetical protein
MQHRKWLDARGESVGGGRARKEKADGYQKRKTRCTGRREDEAGTVGVARVQELTILAGHAPVSTMIWQERVDAGEVGDDLASEDGDELDVDEGRLQRREESRGVRAHMRTDDKDAGRRSRHAEGGRVGAFEQED